MKKLTSILLTLLLTTNIAGTALFSANATTTEASVNTETEPNNVFTQAQSVAPDEVVHGSIADEDIIDFYKISLTERQRVTMYTLGTHYENFHAGYEYGWISESLAFDIYKETPKELNNYKKISKDTCYYYHEAGRDEDFDVEYDGFDIDGEKWEQTEDMVLDAGTYYFVFKFDTLSKSADYKFMYKLSEPVPAIYNKFHPDEFNLKYKSAPTGKYIRLRVSDGEVTSWTSSNPKVAKVNKRGNVAALTKGKTDIIATLANGEELKYNLTVTSDPVLKFNNKKATSISINKGEYVTVKIEGKAPKTRIKYTDTKIAKIIAKKNAKQFVVKGSKIGTTTLKIKVNGKKLPLKVTVK